MTGVQTCALPIWWLVSVHFFAPLDENVTARVRKTKAALYQAGFTWPRSEDASDQDGRHFVFECETAEGVEEASWEA